MYKGFFEDMEYVMGLFFKPFEKCFEEVDDKDEDEEKEKKCSHGCDFAPCMKEKDEEEEDGNKPEEEDKKGKNVGVFGDGPLQDIMKCMFDASDIDYDYED